MPRIPALARSLASRMSRRGRANLVVRILGWVKIPLLGAVAPRVVELTAERCVVRITLRRRTKNHVGSMYLAALSVGAEITPGALAIDAMVEAGELVPGLYKSLHCEFLRRVDDDVYFVCEDGTAIRDCVARAIATGLRQEVNARVRACVGSPDAEAAGRFELLFSLKK